MARAASRPRLGTGDRPPRRPGPRGGAAVVDEETTAHVEEIRRTLARERADSVSPLAEEERRLGEERRIAFVERERRAGEALADPLARTERRLEERLHGFADDLDRSQRHVEPQLARLEQAQQVAVAEVEARIAATPPSSAPRPTSSAGP